MDLPASSSEITPVWLNQALAHIVRDCPIAAVERQVIGAGVGFVGELTRLSLSYHGTPPPEAPRSLIAKQPTADEAVRTLAQLFGFYERELRFYDELAPSIEVRTPRCYLSAADAASGRFVLLLEDLAPGRCGDQLASCSLDDAALALRELARLHAAWWNNPRLAEHPWLGLADEPVVRQVLQALYQQSYPHFEAEFGEKLPAQVIDLGRRFGEHLIEIADALAERPRTLLHSDFRLDNMFFDLPDGSPFALVDWQLVQQGAGPGDVTYFLAGSFPPEVRRAHERELLRVYYDALVQNGVADYSFEQCLEEYRMAALAFFIFLVTGRQNVDMAAYAGRGQTLFDLMVERYVTAIVDLEAADFLPT